uniref:Putative germin-like protein 12-3 n=1 Tax=Rhizophora mucronata TaxID=61149 RepID=A0A2P2JVC5_RHIMU
MPELFLKIVDNILVDLKGLGQNVWIDVGP